MYPKLWEASGISYSELIDRLIELAIERFAREKRLKTERDMILGKLAVVRLILRALIGTSALAILTVQAYADSELVIAIRYLQAEGTSHSHLYLYREDGKLLRQLTNDNSGQDSAPIFSPDGETIVFTREKPKNVREFWNVTPRGTDLKKLDTAPDWYTQAKSSPYFTNVEPQEAASARCDKFTY